MGTSDLSVPGVFSSILVLQAVATRIHPGLCHLTIARLYENHKASETSQKEEAKDASSSLYVKTKTTAVSNLLSSHATKLNSSLGIKVVLICIDEDES